MARDVELSNGHTYMQWGLAFLVNAFTLSYGLECGWTSPTIKLLQSENSPTGVPLTETEISWVACVMSLVATAGVPIYSYISLVFGSKNAVLLLAIPQILSWLVRICYSSATTIIIARVITGLSAGGVFIVVPMYVKEISQDNMRGILGSLLVLMQNSGVFIMYVMGAYLDYYTVMYVSLALPVVLVFFMIKVPPSPAYMVKNGKLEEATRVIALLRGLTIDDKRVLNELEYMRNEEANFQALPNMSLLAIAKSWRKGMILIFAIFTCHALNGAFVILMYAAAILESTGVEFNISPQIQTLSLPFLMLAANILLVFIVERCGRKVILTSAFFITSVSMMALGAAILVKQGGGYVPSWLPVVAMVSVVSMFAGGVSPIPYILLTELFPFQIRGKVMGCVVSYTWFVVFVSVAVFTPVSATLGLHSAFFIFGTVNLLGALLVFTCLPETRGKSDEEIRQMFRGPDEKEQKSSP